MASAGDLPSPLATSVAGSIYGALLLLYPPAFRREFGPEMARDFRDASADAWGERGWSGLCALWASVASDVVQTVASQWLRTGLPAIAIVSPVPALAAIFLAAKARPAGRWNPNFVPADRAVIELILAAVVVVVVLAVTITVTVLFTRPLLYRRR